MADSFIQEDFIRGGTYGNVYKVKCITSGTYYALKLHFNYDSDGQADNSIYGVQSPSVREISALSALRGHPRVIELLDCFLYKNSIATLMPYVPYVLSQTIYRRAKMKDKPLSFVAHFSRQVAEALSYMHALNIVHRDLHHENVLLTENLDVKVADMGGARRACIRMSPNPGSDCCRAPEGYVEDDECKYTCAIDMWSLGMMMVNVMEDDIVFRERNINGHRLSAYEMIRKTLCPKEHPLAAYKQWDLVTVMPNVDKCVLAKWRILELLAFEYSERLSASELLVCLELTLSRTACITRTVESRLIG
uniref:Protein kinase domain-containing protein n=1 Tax=Neogobius melanostomus TaxID=47308 RepID=A0A8C6T5J7_9GOBI